jgi:hypothetical protein
MLLSPRLTHGIVCISVLSARRNKHDFSARTFYNLRSGAADLHHRVCENQVQHVPGAFAVNLNAQMTDAARPQAMRQ